MLQELPGIWAYIKWENDGCPNRSQEEFDAEYQRGIQVQLLFTQHTSRLNRSWPMVCQHEQSLYSHGQAYTEMQIVCCK